MSLGEGTPRRFGKRDKSASWHDDKLNIIAPQNFPQDDLKPTRLLDLPIRKYRPALKLTNIVSTLATK